MDSILSCCSSSHINLSLEEFGKEEFLDNDFIPVADLKHYLVFEVAGSLEVKHEVITYFITSLHKKLQLQSNGSVNLHHLVCIKIFSSS